MNALPLPGYGGEKARRLSHAARKSGILKVSPDGSHVWVFETRPSTLVDGTIFPAREFVDLASEALGIQWQEVFSLDDEAIREIARRLAGITPASLADAREADNAEQ